MSTHKVELKVSCVMDEMEGGPEESAEIARELVEQAVRKEWDAYAEVSVQTCEEVA